MVVLTSTLYCTAGCKKGTIPIKSREQKHHGKVTPFGSSRFISALGNTMLLFECKSFSLPPGILQKGLAQEYLPGGGSAGHDFPTLELFPMALAVCPSQADGWQCSSGPSRLQAGKLQSISLHRQPCFANFPTALLPTPLTFPRAQKPEWPPIPFTKANTWISVKPKKS